VRAWRSVGARQRAAREKGGDEGRGRGKTMGEIERFQ
jgi:hypothetical protein